MTESNTKPYSRREVAYRIAKVIVTNSASTTATVLVKQNTHAEGRLAKAALLIGSFALSRAAAASAWNQIETEIQEMTESAKRLKEKMDDDTESTVTEM